jgi:outer membrane protein TolC
MKIRLLTIFILISGIMQAQEVLNEYVKYGLENNLALKQKLICYDKSIEALREAKGLFYPDISLQARYSISEGGRAIEFPVGDLLNPVYLTLNKLTATNNFPILENQEILFLRPHEHETKIRLIQPVLNPDIYYNSKIKNELSSFEEQDVNQYRRELVAMIRKAYYNAAMASGLYEMLIETRKLLLENVRVNKKLIENDKVTADYLYRSETELSKFDQDLQNAEKNKKVASAYFNFLLNKPLTDTIIIQQPDVFPSVTGINTDYTSSALENREELRKLYTYSNISELKVKMENSGKIPDIFVAVDYGFQGTEYRFDSEHDYVQASAVLSWNIFKGFQNRSKIRQSLLDKEIADQKLEEAKKQIELQVLTTINELRTAGKGTIAAESRLKNAREGFRLVNRKYEQGQATQIEYIDARTTLTQAEENLIISKYNYLSAFAEFEKTAAISKTELNISE